MAHLLYVFTLNIYVAKVTVTYGECNIGESTKFVYCFSKESKMSKPVYCNVNGLSIINEIALHNDTAFNCFSTPGGPPTYGHTGVSVWVTSGCSSFFEVCGEPATTASSEITTEEQTMSSTGLTTINHSTEPTTYSIESTSSGLTEISSTERFTTYTKKTTQGLTFGESETEATKSQTTNTTTVTEPLTTAEMTVTDSQAISNIPVTEPKIIPAITVADSSTTRDNTIINSTIITTVIFPSSKTTTEGNQASISFDTQSPSTMTVPKSSFGSTVTRSSSAQATLTPTYTKFEPIPTAATTFGRNNSIEATTTVLTTSNTISITAPTTTKPSSGVHVTQSFAFSFITTRSSVATSRTSTLSTSNSSLYLTETTSGLISTTLNHGGAAVRATDTGLHHDEATILNTSVIVGITAGGLCFILLCVAYVYIVCSSNPCGSVTPII